METIPKFFSYLYPFMPMTYAVGLFKQSISGVVTADAVHNAAILIMIIVVFMALTILLSGIKEHRTAKAEKREESFAQ
jgi:putative membrane protein